MRGCKLLLVSLVLLLLTSCGGVSYSGKDAEVQQLIEAHQQRFFEDPRWAREYELRQVKVQLKDIRWQGASYEAIAETIVQQRSAFSKSVDMPMVQGMYDAVHTPYDTKDYRLKQAIAANNFLSENQVNVATQAILDMRNYYDEQIGQVNEEHYSFTYKGSFEDKGIIERFYLNGEQTSEPGILLPISPEEERRMGYELMMREIERGKQ